MKRNVAIALVLALPALCPGEPAVRFNRDVRPLLSSRCFKCHGPDAHERQANLRLDRSEGKDGAYRTLNESTAIKPGAAAGSALWQRITSDDPAMVMPPPTAKMKALSAEEKDLIKRWIAAGAVYDAFWAFVPPRKPAVPPVRNAEWSRRAIDGFVLRKLEAAGLTPNPRADRRTLLRRVSFDLNGLPPSREEIRAFLDDTEPGAYERLVDRLLASPRYGEHMTRYWLDLVRFADTNGIHHDHYREMSPYRDWVIRAFNGNLPYDRFLTDQLAGDLYAEPSVDQLVASGFNRLHLIIDVGTALPEESLNRNVVDRVTAVGTAFMGLTVQCASCHDHKYDPITTKDFYQLYAFFNNLDAAPETGKRNGNDFKRGLQPPYVPAPTEAQQTKQKELDRRIAASNARIEELKSELSHTKDSAARGKLQGLVKQAQEALKGVQSEKQALVTSFPVAMVMKERAEPRAAHILLRGNYETPGERVERDAPAFLPPMKPKEGLKTRMDLAEWFTMPENPLTARVAVNRFWQQFFGVGIVKTSEDFGAQGEWPSHPDLLDYLAATFIESGWDVKALVKQIVLSETYRQASEADPDRFQADPENRLLSRGSRFRMDSELIRDQVLATSGLLKEQLYGPSVKPPQPAGLWKAVNMPGSYPRLFKADAGDKIYRRSLYTFWKRGMPPPQMTILNAPARDACIARRERTNTPLQALLLLNEQEYLKAARRLAEQVLAIPSSSAAERLCAIYETVTSQLPDAGESKILLQTVADLETMYHDNPALADALCEGVSLPAGPPRVELAAWTVLASSVYNLDIARTRN